MKLVFALLISVETWMTPQPQLSRGLLVNYGDQSFLEGNAEYRGYDLSHYRNRCALASISPAHLGQIAWVRVEVEGAAWYGPCLVVDVMARHHAYVGIYVNHEIGEIPRWLANRLGFENGADGQIWFGPCPPPANQIAWSYRPKLKLDDGDRHPIFWPYPAQELPRNCLNPNPR